TVEPPEFGATWNAFFGAIARHSPRGRYPRGLRGEMSRWAVVGTAGGDEEALLSEDGGVEIGAGEPSLEPFLRIDGRLWSWADVAAQPSLVDGDLPLPCVAWRGAPVDFEIAAGMVSSEESEHLELRYGIVNRARARRAGRMFLAVRPFLVNPPSQFLNAPSGVCGLEEIRDVKGDVVLDSLAVVASFPPAEQFGASKFDGGDITDFLARGRLPVARALRDDTGHAS